jgi:hypothetical protein
MGSQCLCNTLILMEMLSLSAMRLVERRMLCPWRALGFSRVLREVEDAVASDAE